MCWTSRYWLCVGLGDTGCVLDNQIQVVFWVSRYQLRVGLADMWAQDWSTLIEDMRPYPNLSTFDLTNEMIRQASHLHADGAFETRIAGPRV
ncbi:hypothetical protein BgiBS90_009722 [Biomphalaria glabrata]|nr:hypothetical protein BgiBS90_009722 [Biomphalaria glabrata]